MDWKEKYTKSFIENPYEEEDLKDIAKAIANEINENFIKLGLAHKAQFVEVENRIMLPDMSISFKVQGNCVKYERNPIENMGNISRDVKIVWKDGIFCFNPINTNINIQSESLNQAFIENVYEFLIK